MVDRAVVNASPIILLSRVGELDLLRVVARVVCIPTRVIMEVDAKGGGDSASQALAAASWAMRMDAGEVPATIAAWNTNEVGSSSTATTSGGAW